MAGFMVVMGECYGCGRVFTFNADLVPSIRVNAQNVPDPNAPARPVCRDCVERANPRRIANGLPPIEVLSGAYEAEEVGI